MPLPLESCPACDGHLDTVYSHTDLFDPTYPDYGAAQTNCMLKDVFQVDAIQRHLMACPRCGLMTVSPTYTPLELSRLYGTARMSDHYRLVKTDRPSPAAHIHEPEVIWEREARHSRFIHKAVRASIPDLTGKSVVDIGGQYGYHCREFLGGGAKCFVQDHARPDKIFPGVAFVSTLQELQDIDIAICTHVLEHVVSLKTFLGEIAGRQKPGGVLYVEVPYEVDSRLRNKDFGVPHHINFFTTRSLRNIVASHGYRAEKIALRRLTYGGSPILAIYGVFVRNEVLASFHRAGFPQMEIVKGGLYRVVNKFYKKAIDMRE